MLLREMDRNVIITSDQAVLGPEFKRATTQQDMEPMYRWEMARLVIRARQRRSLVYRWRGADLSVISYHSIKHKTCWTRAFWGHVCMGGSACV